MVMVMVLCSAGGSVLGLALWNPDPAEVSVPSFIGGILGAFIGLALGVALLRRRRTGPPAK